jgi:hypothetical protein
VLFTGPTPPASSAASQISPSGEITDTTPTYTWNPVANATVYQLWGELRSLTGFLRLDI